jgi:hypothetical protein
MLLLEGGLAGGGGFLQAVLGSIATGCSRSLTTGCFVGGGSATIGGSCSVTTSCFVTTSCSLATGCFAGGGSATIGGCFVGGGSAMTGGSKTTCCKKDGMIVAMVSTELVGMFVNSVVVSFLRFSFRRFRISANLLEESISIIVLIV